MHAKWKNLKIEEYNQYTIKSQNIILNVRKIMIPDLTLKDGIEINWNNWTWNVQ
jgi:hypothetical protein